MEILVAFPKRASVDFFLTGVVERAGLGVEVPVLEVLAEVTDMA